MPARSFLVQKLVSPEVTLFVSECSIILTLRIVSEQVLAHITYSILDLQVL
jgi:hypothetical protein